MKHYSFSVAWFPTLTITFPVHSFHAFTQLFCEFIVDSFYWNFPISPSSFQNFALSLIATSALPATSLYSLWAMVFLLTFLPFWQKADDPTDSFHCRFILSFYFSNVIKFHMCRSIFTTSESILFYQLFFLHGTDSCWFCLIWHSKMYPSIPLSMPFLLLLSLPCSFHRHGSFLAYVFIYCFIYCYVFIYCFQFAL